MPEQLSQLDLSKRLREVMLEHGLSVTQLAEVGGVSKSAMEKYLSGPSSPRAITLANICQALSVSPSWLLFGKGEADELNEAIAFITSVFEEMSDLLSDVRTDPAKFALFVEGEPTDEAWKSLRSDVPYSAAKRAFSRFSSLKDNVSTLAPVEIKKG